MSSLSDDHLIRMPPRKPVGFMYQEGANYVARIVPDLVDDVLLIQVALLGKTVKKVKLVLAAEEEVTTEVERLL